MTFAMGGRHCNRDNGDGNQAAELTRHSARAARRREISGGLAAVEAGWGSPGRSLGMMRAGRVRPSEKNKTTSMPVLPGAIFRRSAHSFPAEILLQARMSLGEQAGEPKPVAGEAREPAVLLRPAAREPGSSLAQGKSRVWAGSAVKEAPVTRDEAETSP